MKEQDKIIAKKLNEMQLSNMLEREFKIMVRKILIKLEKRVENLSEFLN